MKIKSIYIVLGLIVLVMLSACKKELPQVWMSSTSGFDGNWYVRYDNETTTDPYNKGYVANTIYNTANNGDSIWLEGSTDFLKYKLRIPVNSLTNTFGSDSVVFDNTTGSNIIVSNGKIIKNAVTLPSGSVVDSIYYQIWVDLGLGNGFVLINKTLNVGGYRKSGFLEDIR